MIEIHNLQFQPLTFNMAGEKTLHLGSRERTAIPDKEVSHEIRLAEKHGLIRMQKQDAKKPSATTKKPKAAPSGKPAKGGK
ncbi:MAG: hypothetical protein V3V05_03700 [Pontiella sp.]